MHKPEWFFYEEIHNKRKEWRWETDVYLEHIFLSGKKYTTLVKKNEFRLKDPFYLHKYHALHSELAKKEYIIDGLAMNLYFNEKNNFIKKIIFQIIPLDPNEIYLIYDIEEEKDFLLSYPVYVPWITLYDFMKKLEDSSNIDRIWLHRIWLHYNYIELIMRDIKNKISQYEFNWLPIVWLDQTIWLAESNITINNINNDTMVLSCTDIWWSIFDIVALNENLSTLLTSQYNLNTDNNQIIKNYADILNNERR